MEYEVIKFEFSIRDMYYVTEVVPFNPYTLVSMDTKEQQTKIIYLPYKPRLGQTIKLKAHL